MAEQDLFGTIGSGLVERLFSSILWFGIAIVIILVLGGLMWFFLIYKRKFDIEVKIISNRAGDENTIIMDKAAILRELKTKNPYFRIWGLQRDMPVPKFNVLQKTSRGDYLEIYRKSEEEFYFLLPPKVDKTTIYKADGTKVPIAQQSQIMYDPELAFWATKRKGTNKKMFNTESLLMKVLPYIPHIIGGVITIFVLYILMDTLPEILAQLQELVASLNQMRAAEITVSNA